MHRRRGFLATVGVVGAVSLAGCSLLEDTFEKSASPGGVGDDALDRTGFEHRETEEISFTETVTALGQSRELRLTNWRVTYAKAVPDVGEDAARFRLFSTPSITVAGTEINPFDALGDVVLFGEVDEGDPEEMDANGDGPDEDIEEEETRTVETLGEDVTYTRYEMTREVGGQELSVFVDVGRFSNDGDLLTAVGVHPQMLEETENIDELARAIEHPFENLSTVPSTGI